jgi:8-oxo-dGTP pyrophosphatase MutT (NUDIX family)
MSYEELRATLQDLLASREQLRMSGEDLSPAAVLLLLYPRDGEYHIILTQRTSRVEHHKGEVSFPGGAWDDGETIAETALREAWEEVGLDPTLVELVGTLDDVTTRSNYAVTPHVAIARTSVGFIANPREVAKLLEVPVRAFYDPAVHILGDEVEFMGRIVPGGHFLWDETVIFGMTYRVLRQFLDLIEPLDFWRSAPALRPD